MAIRRSPNGNGNGNGRGTRTSGRKALTVGSRTAAPKAFSHGGRAVPGKVPRGSLHGKKAKGFFSPLGRFILDKLDRGVILLDVKGKVIDSNGVADRVLSKADGIVLRNGRFAFSDPDIDARLGRLLASTSRSGQGARAIAACVRRPGAATYRVLISPVNVDGASHEVGFVVVLYSPHERREVSADVLLELYGLTRAQADVARKLYAGLSVEQTAAELDLSLNTVRSHLKQIFSKCDVQSQAELMHTFAVGPHSF